METNENIYTTEIISKQGELIADAAYMSEQEASQLKSIVQKIDPTSIVHIRSRKVKAESARDICDYVNGESTDKFFSDVPIEESSLIDMLDKLNPFSK
jgi:exoribonuclease II